MTTDNDLAWLFSNPETQLTVINGGAGAGKTTKLLSLLDEELKIVPVERIAYVSFTRKGTYQGVDLAKERHGLTEEQCKWFRTVHGIGYKLAPSKDVIDKKDLVTISDALGWTVRKTNIIYSELELLQCMWLRTEELTDIEAQQLGVHLNLVRELEAAVNTYKLQTKKVTYEDLLDSAMQPIDVDVAFIDEAQDLSLHVWVVVSRLMKNAKRVYIAGDVNQSIYSFAGAEPAILLDLMKRENTKVIDLTLSHRCPSTICEVAYNALAGDRNIYSVTPVVSNKEGGWVWKFEEEAYQPILSFASYVLQIWSRCIKENKTMYVLAHTTARATMLSDLLSLCAIPHVIDLGEEKMSHAWGRSRLPIARAVYKMIIGEIPVLVSPSVAASLAKIFPGTAYSDCFYPSIYGNADYGFYVSKEEHGVWCEKLLMQFDDWLGSQKLDPITAQGLLMSVQMGSCMKNPGQVLVSTVHRVKGGEADFVIYDASCSKNIQDEWGYHAYVALTRAKEGVLLFSNRKKEKWAVTTTRAIYDVLYSNGVFPFDKYPTKKAWMLYEDRNDLWLQLESGLFRAGKTFSIDQYHRVRKAARANSFKARHRDGD